MEEPRRSTSVTCSWSFALNRLAYWSTVVSLLCGIWVLNSSLQWNRCQQYIYVIMCVNLDAMSSYMFIPSVMVLDLLVCTSVHSIYIKFLFYVLFLCFIIIFICLLICIHRHYIELLSIYVNKVITC